MCGRSCFRQIDAQYRVVSAGDRNAGRGLTVQNLHCSELARWPGNPAETLAGLRAALAPEAELILESTPDGVGGCFHEEWQKAAETGMVRHFFPWWMEPRYRTASRWMQTSLTEEERELMARAINLDLEQIGFRRQVRANFRGLWRGRSMPRTTESCFRASGDSVFELEPIEARLAELADGGGTAAERGAGGVAAARAGARNTWWRSIRRAAEVEGDYSAAEVLELETGLQCAEFAGHVGGLELAQLVTDLARGVQPRRGWWWSGTIMGRWCWR